MPNTRHQQHGQWGKRGEYRLGPKRLCSVCGQPRRAGREGEHRECEEKLEREAGAGRTAPQP